MTPGSSVVLLVLHIMQRRFLTSAPIDSPEFEERFIWDTHLINILIKEVTLGAVARKSN